MRARRLAAAAVATTALAGLLSAPSAHAQAAVPSSWQAGPDILHETPAAAPQLSNSAPWTAAPLLVSGAHAYVGGEFLYQDFLYDDSGANGRANDPGDTRVSNDAFSERTGTYDYPTDPRYGGNAADLVELRVKPLSDSTALRITLTRLPDPSLVAVGVALGTPTSPTRAFPFGANVSAQADHFLTVHGSTAQLDSTAVPVTVDSNTSQIDVRIPHTLWDPGTSVVRLSAGVGLWNQAAATYLLPQQQATSSTPGGSGLLATPAAFFNVAFREGETLAALPHPGSTTPPPSSCMWRDCLQAAALAQNDISPLHDDVDFAKLAAGSTDLSGVPTTGSIDRIHTSHFDFGGGVTYAKAYPQVDITGYHGEYQGNLQPYNVYVPQKFNPHKPYPLTVQLHALSANYNEFMNSRNQSEFGERDGGVIVATAEGRGPDGWYYDAAEADVFEMWADVAQNYDIDAGRVTITGYSMGGFGTYELSTRWPDLFAKDFVTVGPPADGIWLGPGVSATGGGNVGPSGGNPPPADDRTNTYYMLESLRNVPILIWHGTNDELVPAQGPQLVARRLDDLGYRYEMDTFPGYDHFAFGNIDEYQPAADFLDDAAVEQDPAHVSYVVNPTKDFAAEGEVADHAYWLGGLAVRDTNVSPRGNVDVRSEALCVGDAPASATQFGAGVSGSAYTREYKTWGAAPSAPCADTLDITASNVSRIVVDARGAKVDCNAKVNLSADGPVDVEIVNASPSPCGGVLQPAGLGGGTLAASSAVATLPNTAAEIAAPVALPAATALLGALVLGRRRRRRPLGDGGGEA